MPIREVVRSWVVLGAVVPVVRTSEVDDADEGEFTCVHGEIRVSPDVPGHLFWLTESHELGHVVAHASGFTRALRDNFGLSKEVADKIEEEAVARILPLYLDTLQRAGVLAPPAPPRTTENDE